MKAAPEKRLLKSITNTVFLSLCAKVVAFLQTMIVAHNFGLQTNTDIIYYLMSLIVVAGSFFDSINNQVFVYRIIRIFNKSGIRGVLSFALKVSAIIAAIAMLIIIPLLISPVFFLDKLSKFSIENGEIVIRLVRILAPVLILYLLNSFYSVVFSALQLYEFPIVIDLLKNSVIILAVLALTGVVGVESLAWGLLLSYFIQFAILFLVLLGKRRDKTEPGREHEDDTADYQMYKSIGFVITGQSISTIAGIISMYLFSGFSDGVYTAIEYSSKINSMIVSVIIAQLSNVLGVHLIHLYQEKSLDRFKESFLKYFQFSVYVITPFAFVLSLCARPIMTVLFLRGEFNIQDVNLASDMFTLMVLMIPLNLIDAFILKLIITKQLQHISFVFQILLHSVDIPVMIIVMNRYGYLGYLGAEVILNLVYVFVFLIYLAQKHYKFLEVPRVVLYVIRNILIGGLVYLVFRQILIRFQPDYTLLGSILNAIGVTAAFIAAYFIMTQIFPDNKRIFRSIWKEISGRARGVID